jgi:hypothetical protein
MGPPNLHEFLDLYKRFDVINSNYTSYKNDLNNLIKTVKNNDSNKIKNDIKIFIIKYYEVNEEQQINMNDFDNNNTVKQLFNDLYSLLRIYVSDKNKDKANGGMAKRRTRRRRRRTKSRKHKSL